MIYHSGPRIQRGRGLGSILRGLFKSFAPVAKLGMSYGKKLISSPLAQKLGSTALDAAKKSAANIAADVIAGNNLKESAQRELQDAKEKIASTLRAGRKRTGRLIGHRKVAKKSRPRKSAVKNGKSRYFLLD